MMSFVTVVLVIEDYYVLLYAQASNNLSISITRSQIPPPYGVFAMITSPVSPSRLHPSASSEHSVLRAKSSRILAPLSLISSNYHVKYSPPRTFGSLNL